jgi:nucleoside-diphosphate-sugar epimerase
MAVTLVTGATGNVGHAIALALVGEGRSVRVLARDRCARARSSHGLRGAARRCDRSGLRRGRDARRRRRLPRRRSSRQWLPDAGLFDAVNAGGTQVVADAAREAGVRRFVYTSTIDVFAWRPGVPFDETVIDAAPKQTAYERSKQEADRRVVRALEAVSRRCSSTRRPSTAPRRPGRRA